LTVFYATSNAKTHQIQKGHKILKVYFVKLFSLCVFKVSANAAYTLLSKVLVQKVNLFSVVAAKNYGRMMLIPEQQLL
jgi:hypothetical protein